MSLFKHSLSQSHMEWASLLEQPNRLDDKAFRNRALDFASEMLAPVRDWASRTVDHLDRSGYQFCWPEKAVVGPESDTAEWIAALADKKVHIPIALEAWLRTVGSINFMGTHPEWLKSGYVDPSRGWDGDPFYTDPIVVELPSDYVTYLQDEWQEACLAGDDPGPFVIDVAPDYLHKANISGGMPYQMYADKPALDGIVLNERRCTTFMGYLRIAVRWGGFPGLYYYGETEAEVVGTNACPRLEF